MPEAVAAGAVFVSVAATGAVVGVAAAGAGAGVVAAESLGLAGAGAGAAGSAGNDLSSNCGALGSGWNFLGVWRRSPPRPPSREGAPEVPASSSRLPRPPGPRLPRPRPPPSRLRGAKRMMSAADTFLPSSWRCFFAFSFLTFSLAGLSSSSRLRSTAFSHVGFEGTPSPAARGGGSLSFATSEPSAFLANCFWYSSIVINLASSSSS